MFMDNGATYWSQALKDMLDRWNVKCFFRAAYRGSGNGMVEKSHTTIIAIVERIRISRKELRLSEEGRRFGRNLRKQSISQRRETAVTATVDGIPLHFQDLRQVTDVSPDSEATKDELQKRMMRNHGGHRTPASVVEIL